MSSWEIYIKILELISFQARKDCGVMIPELPIGKKNPDLISMILRQTNV